MDIIKFYSVRQPYGEFSNFAPYPITIDDQVWPTSEHYFQAQKFLDKEYQLAIRSTISAMQAAKMGRDRKRVLRDDWELVKDTVMRTAVRVKFQQHPQLAALLLSTGDALLVEHTKNDRYWGDGGDGSGRNMLGQILMEVREELRNRQESF
jgi:N-glycosidase YbiA